MDNDIYVCSNSNSLKKIQKEKLIKDDKINDYNIIYFSKILIIIICFTFIISVPLKTKTEKKNINIKDKVKFNNEIFKNNNRINCTSVKNKLERRTRPFEYEDEFFFITNLIECNIPFSLIRFADGENSIMKGKELGSIDKWHWNPKNKIFRENLIESANICIKGSNFIGIPCKDWINISNSILSFSNCTSAKYMTYATIFTNYNYKKFQKWVLNYINSFNRRKIILVANSVKVKLIIIL